MVCSSCDIGTHSCLHMWGQVLFLQGGVQMIISEVVVAILLAVQFNAHNGEAINKSIGVAVIFFICLFVAGFGRIACILPKHLWTLSLASCGFPFCGLAHLRASNRHSATITCSAVLQTCFAD